MNRPNVLLIMTDQQRFDTLGCYGSQTVETVNLDWLRAEGTLFSHAYSCTPSCIPARASLMTGMDPWNTGILGMGRGQGSLRDLERTLPGELAAAGYHTLGVGKMHFFPQRALYGFHQTVLDESSRVATPGFVSDYSRWFERNKTGEYGRYDHGIDQNSWMARPYHAPEYLHATNWTVSESIRVLEERDPTRPFFLKMSFARPHSPYDPPPYYFDLYMNKELPGVQTGDWAAEHDVPRDAADPNAWRGRRGEEEARRARAGYYGLIHHIDHQIGRLLRWLREQRLLDDTLILFTSDHGDMMGDHHLWRKTYAYEGSAHIPLLIRMPKSKRVGISPVVNKPVCLQDIMPTILDICGADVPDTVDGRSLVPLMRGQPTPWREYVHGEHCASYAEDEEMQYLTDGRWKYIWFPRKDKEQLFDLERDPYECRDVALTAEHRERLLLWRKRLVQELAPRGAGLADGDRLVCQSGRPPVVSPKYRERLERVESRKSLNR